MAEQLEVSVNLTNQKVKFAGSARDNQLINIDYIPPIGDGEGFTSLELLLISLASCSGTSVLSLLRKMKKEISGFRVNAKGIRREVHPLSFQSINLEFVLFSNDTVNIDLEKVIKLSEEYYCPVWNMVKQSVVINCDYKIITYEHGDSLKADKMEIH